MGLNLFSTMDQNRSYSTVKDTQHGTTQSDHPFQLSVWGTACQSMFKTQDDQTSVLYRIVPIYALLPGKTAFSHTQNFTFPRLDDRSSRDQYDELVLTGSLGWPSELKEILKYI